MDINKVILIGRLGKDAEIKYTQANAPVANVSLATERRWKDQQSGEWTGKTEWNRLVAWRGLAERLGKLKKGEKVYVEGHLETRKWEKDGQDHYMTEIIVDALIPFADSVPAAAAPKFTPPAMTEETDDEDDQLPF